MDTRVAAMTGVHYPAKRRRMEEELDPGPSRSTAKRGRITAPRGKRNQTLQNRTVRNERPGSRSSDRYGSSVPKGPRGRARSMDGMEWIQRTSRFGGPDQRALPRLLSNPRGPQMHYEGNQNISSKRNYPNNNRANAKGFENRNQGQGRKKFISFKKLEEMAESDSQDALAKITESKDAFIEIIQSPIEQLDIFVLVVKCLEKVCLSSFNELKLKLLIDTCNSHFIVSLKCYLMELPYASSKTANNNYWNDQDAFWKSLIFFFESLLSTSPTLAMNKCRSLIEATSIACLEGLRERHGYNLPNEYLAKLNEIKEKMANIEKMQEPLVQGRTVGDEGAPPENFRELSLIPDNGDLLEARPFLRPNIVNGAYKDVEHYLDVQFRLLREDCLGPLRQGLTQYIRNNTGKKFENIRVFHNVKFVKPYASETNLGSLVQIDLKMNKNFSRINWNTSKRFIFGTLVLFTKNNGKTFIVGTILDRNLEYVRRGQIPVSIMGKFDAKLYNESVTYTMIESEVYFEPYFHVLKALQDPTFPKELAMKQYIVDVNPEPKHPSYLTANTVYKFGNFRDFDTNDMQVDDVEDIGKLNENTISFTVLQDDTWPEKNVMNFNESQLEAFKVALTHEFAVIQGPPGTGKTYLGIKVAETLLMNLRDQIKGCILLIVCYTNHALDQFLEALMKSTDSIVRIGGQSRNEAMEAINLSKLRSNCNRSCPANHVYRDEKFQLRNLIAAFQRSTVELDIFTNGVLHIQVLRDDIPEIKFLENFYGFSNGDPLLGWLFEYESDYYSNVDVVVEDTNNYHVELARDKRKRTGVDQENEKKNEDKLTDLRNKLASFSMVANDSKINELKTEHTKCSDPIQKDQIRKRINILNARKELFSDMVQHRGRKTKIKINERTRFDQISHIDRWLLYFTWIQPRTIELQNSVGNLQVEVSNAMTAFEESRMLLEMELVKGKRVVGMTTSGAARLRKLLQTLAPPIVIVEEAAEVLEQHIITSLTKHCKHLILIGDHQQLRPSAAHMKLAREYQIEVSLFERMISNGMHSRRLGVQHRMRPEIAALVCPHIYPDLLNHPTVHDFPDVMGMSANLFFFTHQHREQEHEENMSRTNHEEGNLVLALANYLMQQGYDPEDVTILAAYKGQMFYMKKESVNYTHLKGVKITVVDNYQGEESKIILLSLVRNNEDNIIGFLGTPNRICVALSRAKQGFYIFGNIDNLKAKSELWQNIAVTLENSNSLGDALTLKCQNHPDNLTTIREVKDFKEVPEGGCKLPCAHVLARCGHRCQLVCHGYDRDHKTFMTRCPRACEKVLCELNHICPKNCFEDCGPCKRKMRKTLPCGHEADVFCYMEPDDPAVLCHTKVEVTLQNCGHTAKTECYVDIKDVQCTTKCEYRVDKCGHRCQRTCHVNDDPDHERYTCQKPCPRAKAGCTAMLLGDRGDHQCQKKCYEDCDKCNCLVIKRRSTCSHFGKVNCSVDVNEQPCIAKCKRMLPCEHFCKKMCSEKCGDCNEMIVKSIPDCGHEVKMACKETPKRELCTQKCERTMSCGHKCKRMCREECDPALCTEPSEKKESSPCGHMVTLPCHMAALPREAVESEQLLNICGAPCGAELCCGHTCGGSCSACRRGALHVPCSQPCKRPHLCGHLCEVPCNQVCPPCKKQCEVRCRHSRCRKLCGAPCTPCKEYCGRVCAHGVCSRRCNEPCSRAPCAEACRRRLRCGHPCRGLCAEPCPPVCKTCDPDNFPRDFLGDDFDDTARFVLLQDCGHVMEVESMDHLMMSDTEAIEIRRCPFCRKPIINTSRYKDLVNKTFREEINPIKEKIFGTKKVIEEKKQEFEKNVLQFRTKYLRILHERSDIRSVYINLHAIAKLKNNNKISKLQLETVSMCLNITDLIAEMVVAFKVAQLTNFEEELKTQVKLLCSVFKFKPKAGIMMKISEQQQRDLDVEIKRLHSIVQLAKVTSLMAFVKDKVAKEFKAACDAVFTVFKFDQENATESLRILQKAIKVSDVVTAQERALIVKAVDVKAGAWYKCPNGHFYSIGECGGAMEESKCLECGAKIGGTNHALRSDNKHAGELDGSRFAAWSQEYNNMANFQLD